MLSSAEVWLVRCVIPVVFAILTQIVQLLVAMMRDGLQLNNGDPRYKAWIEQQGKGGSVRWGFILGQTIRDLRDRTDIEKIVPMVRLDAEAFAPLAVTLSVAAFGSSLASMLNPRCDHRVVNIVLLGQIVALAAIVLWSISRGWVAPWSRSAKLPVALANVLGLFALMSSLLPITLS